MNQPSDALDKQTNTFTADREFFNVLIAQPRRDAFLEMCAWYLCLAA